MYLNCSNPPQVTPFWKTRPPKKLIKMCGIAVMDGIWLHFVQKGKIRSVSIVHDCPFHCEDIWVICPAFLPPYPCHPTHPAK
ncbi:unnamed protein product [Ranitomeya imitator]|uniref:Uncharacterized protein n=1 Tax=Ranitomeya imitator TaxID=111125 RepID=A0ABN9L946_9NEOB|nr:unnamed protein product [Ranitomeya imitator]